MTALPWWEKHQWPIALVLLGLILAGLGVLGLNSQPSLEEGIEIISETDNEADEVFVDIQGAVNKPGLYQLPGNSRVNDLLVKAGGLNSTADRDWVAQNINLAQKLADGAKIYIPEKNETTAGSVAGTSVAGKININTASIDDLCRLSGIGPSYAQRIIDNRPYQAIEDLLKISGIGPKTLEKIKDQITLY